MFGYGFKSLEGIRRAIKGVRDAERLRKSPLNLGLPFAAGYGATSVVVMITTATPVDGLYHGRFYYRNVESVSPSDEWMEHEFDFGNSEDNCCYVQDINDQPLVVNRRYTGYLGGMFDLRDEDDVPSEVEYNGYPLVLVEVGPASGPAPGEPTDLTATPGVGQAVLDWTAPTGAPAAQQYVVDYSTSPDMSSPTQFVVTPNTDATVTGLIGGTYYFGIYGISEGGTPSGYSNIVSAVVLNGQTIYTTAGTHTFTPTVTGNHTIKLWGTGGAISTSGAVCGGGGGGAYSEKVVALVSGVGKAAVIGDGAPATVTDTTFDGVTVVAKRGGQGSASGGGAGGLAASGVGDIKFSGGDGAAGAGVLGGGGGSSAGPAANGNNAVGPVGGAAVSEGGAGGNGGPAGNAGTAPGGGAGGRDSGAGAVNGSLGRIEITW